MGESSTFRPKSLHDIAGKLVSCSFFVLNWLALLATHLQPTSSNSTKTTFGRVMLIAPTTTTLQHTMDKTVRR
jgi:hypothetical protein